MVQWYWFLFISVCVFSIFYSASCFYYLFFFWAASLVDPSFLPFSPELINTQRWKSVAKTEHAPNNQEEVEPKRMKQNITSICLVFLFFFFLGLISASKFELFALVFFSFCLCKNTDDERKIVERYTFTRLLRHSSLNSIVFPVFRGYRKK